MTRVILRGLLVTVALTCATAMEGCKPSMAIRQPEGRSIVLWDMRWKLTPTEVEAYAEDHPRYLRIGLASEADLVLDEQFKTQQEPDYMSILATSYGAGTPLDLGDYRIVCQRTPTPYYNCGYKFLHDGRTFMLVFRDRPRGASTVARLYDKAIIFIRERSTPYA